MAYKLDFRPKNMARTSSYTNVVSPTLSGSGISNSDLNIFKKGETGYQFSGQITEICPTRNRYAFSN